MQDAVGRERADDRRLEQLEQAERPVIAGRDLAAHQERVRRAVAGAEGDQAIPVQPALVGGLRLAGNVDRLAHGVRLARRNDDDAVGRERDPGPLPHA